MPFLFLKKINGYFEDIIFKKMKTDLNQCNKRESKSCEGFCVTWWFDLHTFLSRTELKRDAMLSPYIHSHTCTPSHTIRHIIIIIIIIIIYSSSQG